MNRIITTLFCVASGLMASHAEEASWVGYYTGDEALGEYGTGMAEAYDCAVYLPGGVGFAAGKSIRGIRFAMQGTADTENLKLWVSTRLPESADRADLFKRDIDTEDMADGSLYEVELDEALWVPAAGLYVGYSFTTTDPFPLFTTLGSTTEANGFYLRTSQTYKDWKDMSQFKSGNLALQVLVDGQVYGNAAQVEPIAEVVAMPGQDVTMPVTVTNMGSEGLTSLEYCIVRDGGEPVVETYVFPAPIREVKKTGVVPLAFTSSDERGLSIVDFKILKVNGVENEISDNTEREGSLVTVSESMARNVVMEEFTGTWCGWCPRGMVALEHLNEDYGPRFIGIAVHYNDPMMIDDYSRILETVKGFPHGRVDRHVEGDPFFGSNSGIGNEPSYGIKVDVDNELAVLTPAEIEISTNWVDKESLEFEVSTSLTLGYGRKGNPDYRIAYVVTADSLCGDEPTWFQNNDFALPMAQGYKDDPYLGWLTDAGQMIRGLKYNDVAIAAYEIEKGYELRGEGEWTAYEGREVGLLRESLKGNKLVQDMDNLSVVALLLDPVTGVIVNGAKTKIGYASSVESVEDNAGDSQIIEIFNLSGQKVDRLGKGVNIVRYSNGEVKKILNK